MGAIYRIAIFIKQKKVRTCGAHFLIIYNMCRLNQREGVAGNHEFFVGGNYNYLYAAIFSRDNFFFTEVLEVLRFVELHTEEFESQDEIELWQWNFFKQVFEDIDSILCLDIY